MTLLSEAPASPPVPEGEWHRLSPRMLLVAPILEIGKAVPLLAGVFLAGSTHGNDYWGLGATAVVGLLAVAKWFTTRLRVTPADVELRHGLLRRRTRSTARDRIRTVDVTAHMLHRALGLSRVAIGTGTGHRSGHGRLVLDGLRASTATALRDELLHRRAPIGSESELPRDPVEAERVLARLRPSWIRYAPFTLSGIVTGLVTWGLYWRVQGESGVDLSNVGPLRPITAHLARLPTSSLVLVVAAAVVVFVAVTSTAGYVLAFWNFRLVQHDGGSVQVTRGLLTTRRTSIDRRRLVGVELSEPLPLRLVGAARTTAVATGLQVGRGAERGGEVLLPPAPRAVAQTVAAQVLDGSPAPTCGLRSHPRVALRRAVNRTLVGAVAVLVAAVVGYRLGAPGWPTIPAAALAALSVPVGMDRYRTLGHAHVDGYLVTAWGSLVRRRVALDDEAVIGWNIQASLFARRAGLVTLTATTAAGRQGYRVRDLAVADALRLADTVSPDLLRQFRPAPTDAPITPP